MDSYHDTFEQIRLRKTIDSYGTITYYDNENQIHRDNAPAIIWKDGSQYWYHHGLQHRIDGPAGEHANGNNKYWFLYGKHYYDEKEYWEEVERLKNGN